MNHINKCLWQNLTFWLNRLQVILFLSPAMQWSGMDLHKWLICKFPLGDTICGIFEIPIFDDGLISRLLQLCTSDIIDIGQSVISINDTCKLLYVIHQLFRNILGMTKRSKDDWNLRCFSSFFIELTFSVPFPWRNSLHHHSGKQSPNWRYLKHNQSQDPLLNLM